MSKTVSFLYRLARLANDVEKIKSGDPKKIARRVKNKVILISKGLYLTTHYLEH